METRRQWPRSANQQVFTGEINMVTPTVRRQVVYLHDTRDRDGDGDVDVVALGTRSTQNGK